MSNPHVLVVPYPAQGHVIPLMEISLCLIKFGIKVTFVNTEHNQEQVKNSLSATEGNIGDQIRLVSISDGMQSSDDRNKPGRSETILRIMPGKVEDLIEQMNLSDNDKISCILADQSIGWALEIAEKKGIRRAAFCPAAAATLVLGFSIPKLIEDGIIDNDGTPTKYQIIKLSPTMPEMNTSHFVWACLGNMKAQRTIFGLMVRNNKSIQLTDWLLCNSTYDLEPAAFNLAPQILPLGPLLASNRHGNSGGNFLGEDPTCTKWLDQHPPKSVIYIAFGSSSVFNTTQFQELALALEISSRPYLWVVRSNPSNNAFLEEFQDRVGGNHGKIVSWSPQQKVLAHASVACFISHCGWNSIMEGVSNGVPFLCWPYFADQFFNQSYICDIWQIGLGLNKDEKGMITRWEINNKLEQLLSSGEFKARAMELKGKVMSSVTEDGSSHQNFKKFVEWIKLSVA